MSRDFAIVIRIQKNKIEILIRFWQIIKENKHSCKHYFLSHQINHAQNLKLKVYNVNKNM